MIGAAALLVLTAIGSSADAHTCGSDYCSGSDSSGPTTNIQGNDPQVYLGEVGQYYVTFEGQSGACPGDPGQNCFNTTAASNASSRADSGSGIGVQTFYVLGGPEAKAASGYATPYCWGRAQATDAIHQMSTRYFYGGDNIQNMIMAADIEQNTGWSSAHQTEDRQVFDGFADYLAGKASADSHCTSGSSPMDQQYAVFSWNYPPSWVWHNYFGSSGVLPETYIWTSDYRNLSSFPSASAWRGVETGTSASGSQSGVANWFGNSNHDWAWQFDDPTSTKDYDDVYEPDCLPVFGNYCVGN